MILSHEGQGSPNLPAGGSLGRKTEILSLGEHVSPVQFMVRKTVWAASYLGNLDRSEVYGVMPKGYPEE